MESHVRWYSYLGWKTLKFPLVIFVVSAVLTGLMWDIVRTDIQEDLYQEFIRETLLIEEAIENRMDVYVNALRSGNGLFGASEFVSRDEWNAFVDALELSDNFPGIQGFGYTMWVTPEEREAHIERVREEGFPDFTIRPEGEREVYTSIIYLEPFDVRNQQAFGFDMFSETTRREAMTLARDTGDVHLSGRVTLVQEIDEDVQAGFLIYVPQYTNGMPTQTTAQRRDAIEGFVYSPFRARDFMNGILGDREFTVDFAVFDGEGVINESTKLYDSSVSSRNFDRLDELDSPFVEVRTIELTNHVWTLYFSPRDEFVRGALAQNTTQWIVAGGGGLISILLTILVYSLAISRARAVHMAEDITKDLKKRVQENETIRKELVKSNALLENQAGTLIDKVDELEKLNSVMTGRELKMKELKEQLKEAKDKLGQTQT